MATLSATQQQQITKYQNDYVAAKTAGNAAAMKAANDAANKIRTSVGTATQNASNDIGAVAAKATTKPVTPSPLPQVGSNGVPVNLPLSGSTPQPVKYTQPVTATKPVAYAPTGTYNDADLTAADKAKIAALQSQYQAATTQAEKDRIHAAAEAIRAQYNYSGGTDGSGYSLLKPVEEEKPVSDINSLIEQLYKNSETSALLANQYAVDKGTSDLNAELARQKASFADQRGQTAIDAANTQNSAALRSALLGDQGGIGQAQYNNIAASRDQSLANINVASEQLKADTAKQIADLEAQGKFQEAQIIADVATQKLQALISEATRLQELEIAQTADSKQDFINTLGAYYGDYSAQINKIKSDGDPSNDWQIAYLEAAKQQKIADEKAAAASSTGGGAVDTTKPYGLSLYDARELYYTDSSDAPNVLLTLDYFTGSNLYEQAYGNQKPAVNSGEATPISAGSNFQDAIIGTALQTYYNQYAQAGETPAALEALNAAAARYGYKWDAAGQTFVPIK